MNKIFLILLLISAPLVFSEEKKPTEVDKIDKNVEQAKEEKAVRKIIVNRSNCAASDAALDDMNQKRKELEEKEKKITEQMEQIQAKEKTIADQLKQLEDLKKEISLIESQRDGKSEEKLSKLVEAIEKMSPKKASELLANLDNKLAVESMMRLSSEKLAKVMNLMDVKRSSQLSELLTKGKIMKKEGGKDESTRNPAKNS